MNKESNNESKQPEGYHLDTSGPAENINQNIYGISDEDIRDNLDETELQNEAIEENIHLIGINNERNLNNPTNNSNNSINELSNSINDFYNFINEINLSSNNTHKNSFNALNNIFNEIKNFTNDLNPSSNTNNSNDFFKYKFDELLDIYHSFFNPPNLPKNVDSAKIDYTVNSFYINYNNDNAKEDISNINVPSKNSADNFSSLDCNSRLSYSFQVTNLRNENTLEDNNKYSFGLQLGGFKSNNSTETGQESQESYERKNKELSFKAFSCQNEKSNNLSSFSEKENKANTMPIPDNKYNNNRKPIFKINKVLINSSTTQLLTKKRKPEREEPNNENSESHITTINGVTNNLPKKSIDKVKNKHKNFRQEDILKQIINAFMAMVKEIVLRFERLKKTPAVKLDIIYFDFSVKNSKVYSKKALLEIIKKVTNKEDTFDAKKDKEELAKAADLITIKDILTYYRKVKLIEKKVKNNDENNNKEEVVAEDDDEAEEDEAEEEDEDEDEEEEDEAEDEEEEDDNDDDKEEEEEKEEDEEIAGKNTQSSTGG